MIINLDFILKAEGKLCGSLSRRMESSRDRAETDGTLK